MLKPIERPTGFFRNVNCMTPKVLGYYRLPDGAVAELSTGRAPLSGGKMWGISVRVMSEQGLNVRDDTRSRAVFSERDAMSYLEELSEE